MSWLGGKPPQQLSPSFSSQPHADTTIYHHTNGVGGTDHKPFHIASTIISNQLLVEKHQEICREKAQYYYGTHSQCITSTGHYATKCSTLDERTHCSTNLPSSHSVNFFSISWLAWTNLLEMKHSNLLPMKHPTWPHNDIAHCIKLNPNIVKFFKSSL